ncbi:MAG: ABC transporter ATP-binding protein/permease [Oscillospiraceae bacterium]|jgi:ABC-type multidrug transport system fused ATPase/permease subunit|nr:ABC transporter ATP-binding protein/permease [Oscillospiraceae bacterium]
MLKNIRYILGFAWRADRLGTAFQFLAAIVSAVGMTAQAIVLKILIDAVVAHKPLSYMLAVAVGYSVLILITLVVINPLQTKVNSRQNLRTEKLLKKLLLDKITRIDSEQYDDPEFYDKLTKAMDNADKRIINAVLTMSAVFTFFLNAAGSAAIITAISPLFLVLAALSVIATHFSSRAKMKRSVALYQTVTPMNRRSDYFKSILGTRETAADLKQYSKFGTLLLDKFGAALNERHTEQGKFDNKILKINVTMSGFDSIVTTLIPYVALAYQAFYGLITLGNMSAMMALYVQFRQGATSLTTLMTQIKEHCIFIEYLKSILDYEPKIENTQGAAITEINEIEFQNVRFKYPNSDTYALDGVSFKIKKGQKAALVGINGAGKTSIVKLMLRFYDPDSGLVLINGRDIRGYDINSLRSAATSVFQEFQSYSLPVSEFVSCEAIGTLDEEKVKRSLEQVGLLDRINSEAKGIHTEYSKFFDETGIVLSGGQLQKLVIARMLYKGSAFLIMDEPSSALDPEAEYEINREISKLLAGRTLVLISHRLSTTRDADNIILIENGIVREQGSHNDLIQRNGRYAQLFQISNIKY